MINYIKGLLIFLFSAAAFGAFAQTTSTISSPYSTYGLGDYQDPLLPQQRAMGIGVAVRKPSGYNDINIMNPASYSSINLTTIDIGAYLGVSSLSTSSISAQTSSNARLGHVAFAIPVTQHSALSFGIVPYANVGYSYRQSYLTKSNNGSTGGADTSLTANSVYEGQGGLSKAYMGYGFGVGENLNLGFNVAYIFGNEKRLRTIEYPNDLNVLNSTIENSFNAGGINFDYGAQYNIKISETRRFTIAYSGSAGSQLNTTSRFQVTQYFLNSDGSVPVPRDTLTATQTTGKLSLPLIHRFGITYQRDSKYMIGLDYKIGQWSNLSIDGVNQGLQNDQSLAIGGQITPNIDAISNYLAVVDYRFGLNYEKTPININGTSINQYGVSVGLGLPIPNERRTSFYKVNISAEIGRRGTQQNSLVLENFYNFHIGFTINDKWFTKYKFD